MFRWSSSFAYSIATKYSQGEFGIGGVFYPLYSLSKSIVQPLFYVDGFIGLGRMTNQTTSKEETRMDAGYNMGVGVDIEIFKKYGLNFIIESHSGGEASQRMLIGFYSKG